MNHCYKDFFRTFQAAAKTGGYDDSPQTWMCGNNFFLFFFLIHEVHWVKLIGGKTIPLSKKMRLVMKSLFTKYPSCARYQTSSLEVSSHLILRSTLKVDREELEMLNKQKNKKHDLPKDCNC